MAAGKRILSDQAENKTEQSTTNIKDLNKRVFDMEQYFDIKIIHGSEERDTVFEKFISFTKEQARFILKDKKVSAKYNILYSFTQGELITENEGEKVAITDLFSNRHLRSILFAGREVLEEQDNTQSETFIDFFRKHLKKANYLRTPIICMENKSTYQKWWMMVSNVLSIKSSQIEMQGLLSLAGDNFRQPTLATCVYDTRNEELSCKYFVKGEMTNEMFKAYMVNMATTTNISQFFYAYTRYKISKEINNIPNCKFTELSLICREIFNGKTLNLYSDDRIWGENYLNVIFYDIKSINPKTIVFRVCDGYEEMINLYYDREKKTFSAYHLSNYSSTHRKVKYNFASFFGRGSGETEFLKAIESINGYCE